MKKNSTIIEFQRSEYIIEEDRKEVLYYPESVITTTFFLIPIRFFSNNVEILEFKGNPWLQVPILDFAISGYNQFLDIYHKPFVECSLGDTGDRLILEKKRAKIKVSTATNRAKFVWIDSQELFFAFAKFIRDVRNYMVDEVPEILQFELIDGWVRGTYLLDYILDKKLINC